MSGHGQRDLSKPGPVANFVFAGLWLLVAVYWIVWAFANGPVGYLAALPLLALAAVFTIRAFRLLRAQRQR